MNINITINDSAVASMHGLGSSVGHGAVMAIIFATFWAVAFATFWFGLYDNHITYCRLRRTSILKWWEHVVYWVGAVFLSFVVIGASWAPVALMGGN